MGNVSTKNFQTMLVDKDKLFEVAMFYSNSCHIVICTIKLGDKERFDKEQIGVKEPFPLTNSQFTS